MGPESLATPLFSKCKKAITYLFERMDPCSELHEIKMSRHTCRYACDIGQHDLDSSKRSLYRKRTMHHSLLEVHDRFDCDPLASELEDLPCSLDVCRGFAKVSGVNSASTCDILFAATFCVHVSKWGTHRHCHNKSRKTKSVDFLGPCAGGTTNLVKGLADIEKTPRHKT